MFSRILKAIKNSFAELKLAKIKTNKLGPFKPQTRTCWSDAIEVCTYIRAGTKCRKTQENISVTLQSAHSGFLKNVESDHHHYIMAHRSFTHSLNSVPVSLHTLYITIFKSGLFELTKPDLQLVSLS